MKATAQILEGLLEGLKTEPETIVYVVDLMPNQPPVG